MSILRPDAARVSNAFAEGRFAVKTQAAKRWRMWRSQIIRVEQFHRS
jgi:hypothetical protein